MYNLLLDIGNSTSKVALSKGVTIEDTLKCTHAELIKTIKSLTNNKQIDTIALSSVCGENPTLEDFLKTISHNLVKVKGDINLPFKNLYRTPQTLGADRICAIVAVQSLFPEKDCIIFDFGTAITIDFLNKYGEYEGGNISLGLSTRFKAINQYTKQLPLLSAPESIKSKGDSTIEAISSGIVLGIMFEVKGYIEKYPGHTIVFTGGDAIYFVEKMKNPIFVVYNLVLMGLARIATINAAKE